VFYKIVLDFRLLVFFFFTATNRQEQKDRVKIFKQIWRNLPFGTNLLWMSVKVFFKQIRIFLCGQFLMSRTAQCAQLLWTGEWNTGWCCMWRIVSYL